MDAPENETRPPIAPPPVLLLLFDVLYRVNTPATALPLVPCCASVALSNDEEGGVVEVAQIKDWEGDERLA